MTEWKTEGGHYERFGWQDEAAYLYGHQLYAPTRIDRVKCSPKLNHRIRALNPNKNGTVEKWSRVANTLFAKGCEAQSFALLCSFAAPLMRLFPRGDSGAILSLVNDQSGSGATTALEAVVSVWGREEGLKITDDDARADMSLGHLGNMPIIYDELANRDPEMIRNFVHSFTNGNEEDDIRTLMVVATDYSIVDILSSVAGGDDYRVLEFKASTPVRKIDSRELKANSGWAGDTYLRRLVQPETINYIRAGIPKWTDEVWTYTGLVDKHRFWVRTIVAVIAASTIVKGMGLLDFSPSRIATWAMDEVKSRIDKNEVAGPRSPIAAVSEYLKEHLHDSLVVKIAWTAPRQKLRPLIRPTGNLAILYELDTGHIYVSEKSLTKWMEKKSVDKKAVVDTLLKSGVMLREHITKTLGGGTEYAGRQVTTYMFNALHPAVNGAFMPFNLET